MYYSYIRAFKNFAESLMEKVKEIEKLGRFATMLNLLANELLAEVIHFWSNLMGDPSLEYYISGPNLETEQKTKEVFSALFDKTINMNLVHEDIAEMEIVEVAQTIEEDSELHYLLRI